MHPASWNRNRLDKYDECLKLEREMHRWKTMVNAASSEIIDNNVHVDVYYIKV